MIVSFTHRGERYTVEPYSVGYERKDEPGNNPLILRAWCEDGWRDFQVKFMSRLEISREQFSADRLGLERLAILLCHVYGKASPEN
jgi:hypothetical protein